MIKEITESIFLQTVSDTERYAKIFSKRIHAPSIIFLEGPVGAGKTTFLRGLLKARGFNDYVKSPTFTLIETYQFDFDVVVHMDLYRLKNPDELESIGFWDYFAEDAICVIEWAQHAGNLLPKPSVLCNIKVPENAQGRILEITEQKK
ncbi:MAG: hypothetical protein ACD_29C00057G0001 [uncultured bacterium]|nr:MAG: hypothetical protein ACD_29C00057G0001 [uncultured bacterium]